MQHTFDAARSVEFDALLIADAPAPAPGATGARDAKAATARVPEADPRALRMVDEAWRHAKAIAAFGTGVNLLQQAGFTDTPGVVTAASGPEALTALQELMASHRVWERFPTAIG